MTDLGDKLDVMEKRRVRSEVVTRSVVIIIVAVVICFMALLLYIASLNKANGDRLVDCTTPGGTCYTESQERTGEAVSLIGLASIAAAACADRPAVEGFAEIKVCVENLLTAQQ